MTRVVEKEMLFKPQCISLTEASPQNVTFNDNTDQFKTDVTSGGLVQSPLRSPTATPGMSFDAAKLQKRLYLCKFILKKLLFARLAFENPLHKNY